MFVHPLFVTGLVVLSFASYASAQELRGSVRGTVTDSSGSIVAGSQVSLKTSAPMFK